MQHVNVDEYVTNQLLLTAHAYDDDVHHHDGAHAYALLQYGDVNVHDVR